MFNTRDRSLSFRLRASDTSASMRAAAEECSAGFTRRSMRERRSDGAHTQDVVTDVSAARLGLRLETHRKTPMPGARRRDSPQMAFDSSDGF